MGGVLPLKKTRGLHHNLTYFLSNQWGKPHINNEQLEFVTIFKQLSAKISRYLKLTVILTISIPVSINGFYCWDTFDSR